jgi:hypothetical protein
MNLELDELFLHPGLYIAKSDTHRWGVFTSEDINMHDVLQESPYCTFSYNELRKKGDILIRYTYDSSENIYANDCVLGFGFAGIYNHSSDYNAAYELDTVNEVMRHYATEDIPAGSEIYIDYGHNEDENDFGDY